MFITNYGSLSSPGVAAVSVTFVGFFSSPRLASSFFSASFRPAPMLDAPVTDPTAAAAEDEEVDAAGFGFGAVFDFLGGTTTPGNSLRFLPPLAAPAGFVVGGFAVEAIGGDPEEEARGGDIAATVGRRDDEEEAARIGGGGAADRLVTALHDALDQFRSR